MRDLADPKWMYFKAVLLLLILVSSAGLLLAENPSWRTAALLALVVWASARVYYFLFYVIERYIDSSFRFAGVIAAVRYLLRRNPRDERTPPGTV